MYVAFSEAGVIKELYMGTGTIDDAAHIHPYGLTSNWYSQG